MVRRLSLSPKLPWLNIGIEWVPLSMKGAQQRGDVYLEMTFFAAGPAPLTRRPSMQVRLPGAWPGPSAQQQQQPAQPAAPSHPNRRSSKGDDSPLPPLPQADVGPKEGALPSILRPGGPSRTTMQP